MSGKGTAANQRDGHMRRGIGDVPAAEIIRRDFKEYVLPQPSANAHRQSQPID